MTVEQLTAYELIEKKQIEEIHSLSYVLRHKKTGARVALLQNDDKNKSFFIGFRTPPKNSTGVAHILEHSVLCGSEKYPLKDPFIELAKGSLNTFLNAMTFPDRTIYPIASCNDKDFQNLMSVYLDAVFHPNIYKEDMIFRQEGWHYEMEDIEDDLKINGVVYNEMKGVYSSPDDVVDRKIWDSLYEGHVYGLDSGGAPEKIPELTYEEFLDFHRQYYHPGNSYIYLYGNMDMAEKLEYLDKEYLSKYEKLTVDSVVSESSDFDKMKECYAWYSVMDEEEMNDATYLSFATKIKETGNKELNVALPILEYAICSAQGAPIRKALIDKGIGEDVYSNTELGVEEPLFAIIAKNTSEDKKEEFLNTIRDVITELVENGIDKKALLAGLNMNEFHDREADYGNFPKGLVYGLEILNSWIYDDKKVFDYLEFNEIYKKLRREMNNGYFENLLKKCLLENKNAVMLVVSPKLNMNEEIEEALAEKLKEKKNALSKEEQEKIVEETIALREFQEREETKEALETIPLLEREDIDKESVKLKNQLIKTEASDILMHDIETNGIAYLRYMFDVSDLEEEMLPYLGFLRSLLGFMDTEKYTYSELFNEVNIRTGGISALLNISPNYEESDKYSMMLEIKTKVLYGQMEPALEVMKEIILNTHFTDKQHIKELLFEITLRAQSSYIASGHTFAANRAISYINPVTKLNEKVSGYDAYKFMKDVLDNFDDRIDEVIINLEKLYKRIFVKERMLVDYTGTKEALDEVKDISHKLYNELPDMQENKGDIVKLQLQVLNEAFKTSGQVQFVCRAGSYMKKGLPYTGALKVLRTIMSYDYLWVNVRVKGGAYGCGCVFTRSGEGYFTSYRDPNLEKTIDVFKKTGEYLRNFVVDERTLTQYVIGTISDMDTPMTPAMYGAYCLGAYLSNITEEMLQKDRDEVLNITEADIRKLAEYTDAVIEDGCVCVVGTANKIEENKEMFGKIDSLM